MELKLGETITKTQLDTFYDAPKPGTELEGTATLRYDKDSQHLTFPTVYTVTKIPEPRYKSDEHYLDATGKLFFCSGQDTFWPVNRVEANPSRSGGFASWSNEYNGHPKKPLMHIRAVD